MRFRWEHCDQYKGDINYYEHEKRTCRGWVTPQKTDDGDTLFLTRAPGDDNDRAFTSLRAAMRHVRHTVIAYAIGGHYLRGEE